MGELCPEKSKGSYQRAGKEQSEAGEAMKNKLSQSNKGFTLVELCVVMVIFSILASISTMGIMSWHQYSLNNKADENAQLVYMALKNKLTILKANGSIKEVKGLFENDEDDDGNNIADSSDGYLYMICQKNDYSAYTKPKPGETVKGKGAKLLLDLIMPYIQDKSILDACIGVVLNQDREIVSVFYCDRCDKFIYGSKVNGSTNKKIYLKSIKNEEEKQTELVVGIYSPD